MGVEMAAIRKTLIVATGLLALAAVSSAQGGLFHDAAIAGDETALRPGVERSRPVDVDLEDLTAEDDGDGSEPRSRVVFLNLFHDVAVSARVTRTAGEGHRATWQGQIEGQPESSVLIVVDDGIVTGRVETPEATYAVRWAGDRHVVEERVDAVRTARSEPVPLSTDARDRDAPEEDLTSSVDPEDHGLFSLRSGGSDAEPELGTAVVRSRAVNADLAGLMDDGATVGERPLRLNLFGDAVVSALLAPQKLSGGMAWVGRLEGEPHSDVVLVVHEGVLAGSVTAAGGTFSIRSDGTGYIVEEIDHSLFPELHDCALEVPRELLQADLDPAVALDDGSFVDVLVAYTPAARAAEGGTTQMEARINLAITETNQAYASSGVVQRLRLAGTTEVSYTEADISSDLSRLKGTTDGYLDSLHALRDGASADLVSLIGQNYAACGVAYVMSGNTPGFAPWAFSVVDRTCMTGYYSFGHELGHNMGLNHDRAQYGAGGSGSGAYSYSYGYQDPGEAFRTIMAYNCTGGCTRVKYFSNPDVQYGGLAMGVDENAADAAHNALSLNNTRVTVANWRSGGAPAGPDLTVLTPNGGESWAAGSSQTLSWSSSNATGTDLKIHLSDGINSYSLGTVPLSWGGAIWTVPNAPGSWRIKLCIDNPSSPSQRSRTSSSARSCEASDASDAAFAITGP